jgi:hypothetical protein
MKQLKRLLRYLNGIRLMGITYGRQLLGEVVMLDVGAVRCTSKHGEVVALSTTKRRT